ncbi:hypothetical protein HAX54_033847 [Datura stramonium]|uniref:Uncharacterized protein n=1 Tax=Datura stramonium TaxID=4076 RepID=A0ABS8VG57_DATST|nr:hypothetical protein [Datura stramonium]
MFQKHKHQVRLLKKLRMTLLGLQGVLSDAENKQASNPFEKLEDTLDTLEVLENQIDRLGLTELFDSGKQETRRPSTSLVEKSGIFGRQKEIEELIGGLLSKDANGKNCLLLEGGHGQDNSC